MTLSEFSETYYMHESHFEDIKVKDGTFTLRLGICYWMQDWYDPRTMPQKGSVRAVFSGVTLLDIKDGFDYFKAEIAEAYFKDGVLLFGLWDDDHAEYAYLRISAEDVEVTGPLRNIVSNPPSPEVLRGKDIYLRFTLEYGTRPLWIVDSRTNVMMNRTFPEGWESDKGLLVAFSEIRDRYKALFVDTLYEFSYKGFPSAEERDSFISLVSRMKAVVRERNDGEYYIQDDIDLSVL